VFDDGDVGRGSGRDVRPISASPPFDSHSARVQVRHDYISLSTFVVNPSQGLSD
jgi:hypothetical protein